MHLQIKHFHSYDLYMMQNTPGLFKIIGAQGTEKVPKRHKFMQPEHKTKNNTKNTETNLIYILLNGDTIVDVKD